MNNETVILHAEDDRGHANLIEKGLKRSSIDNRIIHFWDGQDLLDFLFNPEHISGMENDAVNVRGKFSEKVSDSAGRFAASGGRNVMKGYGEPHNIRTETKKRLIKLISGDIEKLIKEEGPKKWSLAAEKSINRQVLKNLSSDVNNKLDKNIIADLTKTAKSKLLNRFGIK